jgi:hypothetical protein
MIVNPSPISQSSSLATHEALESTDLQALEEPLSIQEKKNLHVSTEANSGTFIDKALPIITCGNVLINLPSLIMSLIGLKKDGLEDKVAKFENYGLYATKAQAVTAGASLIANSLKTKNIILLLAGLAQAFKLPSGFNRLIRLSGIPASIGQIPSTANLLTGKDTYESFGESWKENTRVLGEVWNEFKNDPKGFLKFFGIIP